MSLCETLAEFALAKGIEDEATARHAARRTLLNAIAVAAGGSNSIATSLALRVSKRFSLTEEATVIGHSALCDATIAALVNGISAHVEDFDDTHMATIVHPGAAVVPAALAAAELRGAPGNELLDAIVVGVEIALRIGMTVYPAAFDAGWHMSGLAGPVGAAAAAGRVLRLDVHALRDALVIAAAQGAGTQEALGTMTKPLHLGKSAANGLEAALLAQAGLSTPPEGIAGEGGLMDVFAGEDANVSAALRQLGYVWEIEKNAFKPYACGVVSHAAIDAAIRLRYAGCDWRSVSRLKVRTNPVVLDVMGVKAPVDELQAKFSIYHCVAVAMRFGAAAPAQFRDDIVRDCTLASLRKRVEIDPDPACAIGESEITAMMDDAKIHIAHVLHALGTPLSPLSDNDLCEKARGAAGERLGSARAEALIEALLAIETKSSIADVLALTVPADRGQVRG